MNPKLCQSGIENDVLVGIDADGALGAGAGAGALAAALGALAIAVATFAVPPSSGAHFARAQASPFG